MTSQFPGLFVSRFLTQEEDTLHHELAKILPFVLKMKRFIILLFLLEVTVVKGFQTESRKQSIPRNNDVTQHFQVSATLESSSPLISSSNKNSFSNSIKSSFRRVSPTTPAHQDLNFLRKRTSNLLKDTDSQKNKLKTFHFLLDSWAHSRELEAAGHALKLLDRLEKTAHLEPDARTYSKVILCLARSKTPNAGLEAERILEKMEQLSEVYSHLQPNIMAYTMVMEAHASEGQPDSAERAEALYHRLMKRQLQPNARTFNTIMSAYAREGNIDKVVELFREQERIYKSGVPEAKPNSYNFNTLINAYTNSNSPGASQKAEAILERMEKLYKAGDEGARPRTASFNAVIDAYAKSGEAGAPQRAEQILRHMEDLYESGENVDAKPNVRSFNSVINAYAKSGEPDAAQKALNMLEFMEKLYKGGNPQVRPDSHSFCTVINAWARSSARDKADRALHLFEEMTQLYKAGNHKLRPSVIAVNAVLNACAYTRGDISDQTRAVEVAQQVMRTLESYQVKADQVTYGTFLKVCANQLPHSESRHKVVDVLVKRCCSEGQFGNMVLQQLMTMTSDEDFTDLLGQSKVETAQMEDLPQEWWRNVCIVTEKRRR